MLSAIHFFVVWLLASVTRATLVRAEGHLRTQRSAASSGLSVLRPDLWANTTPEAAQVPVNASLNFQALDRDDRPLGGGGGNKEEKKLTKAEEERRKANFEDRMHDVFGTIVFVSFGLALCVLIPLIRSEYAAFQEKIVSKEEVEEEAVASEHHGDHEIVERETFTHYLEYRFANWFTSYSLAPGAVLLLMTLATIVVGALCYAMLVGGSPARALWRVFVWATGSPAENEKSPGGRFLGIIVTVCGLMILSLLLSIMTEIFGSKMKLIKDGLLKVVEGGHVLILGYSDCTRCLLEELANAQESKGGGCFVILSEKRKEDVEYMLHGEHLNIRNSKVIVRSGNPCVMRDLNQVSANTASVILVMADPERSPEEADARSMRTILALKTKDWPKDGRIVVQCCCEPNRDLFRHLCGSDKPEKIEVVVVGDIVAKLMAQSSQMVGLAQVFSMMLGFEGNEFYSKEWPECVGKKFKKLVFSIPDAVVVGIMTKNNDCMLNPGWDYVYKEGEKLIVLAEDDDAYEPQEALYYEYTKHPMQFMTQRSLSPVATLQRAESMHPTRSKDKEAHSKKMLVIGWNNQISPLLETLNGIVPKGTEVEVYTYREVSFREEFLHKVQEQRHQRLDNLTIKHLWVEASLMTSRFELEKLKHYEHDSIFILADIEKEGRTGADERTMAALAQLQHLSKLQHHHHHHHHGVPQPRFDPVVEMCEDSTAEHLKICGLNNFVHSNSLVSQAIAAVAEEASTNAIYNDLMSADENHFEFRDLADFWPEDETMPTEVCFGELIHLISLVGDISLIAWSKGEGEDREWELNPTDKTEKRPWSDEDQLVVIRRTSAHKLQPIPEARGAEAHSATAAADASGSSGSGTDSEESSEEVLPVHSKHAPEHAPKSSK